MKSFFARLIDSADGSIEAHSVATILAIAAMTLLTGYSVLWLGHAFDAATYGQGVGVALGGGGAAALGQGLQRRAESQAKPDNPN